MYLIIISNISNIVLFQYIIITKITNVMLHFKKMKTLKCNIYFMLIANLYANFSSEIIDLFR